MRSQERPPEPVARVGQEVRWASQAAGSTRTKTGFVVATAHNAGAATLTPVAFARREFPSHKLQFDGLRWPANGILVEVHTGYTARAKPRLYMPSAAIQILPDRNSTESSS